MNKSNQSSILITTPIFYPNDKPHVGSAHTLILADILARFYKVLGTNVFFTTGVDENCEKIVKASLSTGLPTKVFVDNMAENFKKAMKVLEINYDRFIRTTDEDHKKSVQAVWRNLKEKGFIYKGQYEGYYSVADETFFSKSSLVNGKAPTGAEVRLEKEDAYFFKIGTLKEKLLNFFEKNPNFTSPKNRINELQSFLKQDLNDLCISRKNNGWGIEVPDDNKFVIYVWFDALINYITVCDYPNLNNFWQGGVIHLIGKDILTFHGVYWPLLLIANDIKVCDKLMVHNWWISNEEKMSKSKGNIIDPLDLVEKYGVNPLRFYCFKENLMKHDGNFDILKLIESFNTFAVGKFSNLVFRLWVILDRNNIKKHKEISNPYFESKINNEIKKQNLSEVFDLLFEWCDILNQKIDLETAWKNPSACNLLFGETLSLIKYFTPIFPDIEAKMHSEKAVMLFTKIEYTP